MTSKNIKQKGFTLLVAVLITSVFLIVSFVVINVAVKQLLLANSAEQSQHAFYAADSGTECAVYWDLASTTSKFDPSTPGTISCNGQTIGPSNPQTVETIPTQPAVIGGNQNSIFQLNFIKGCAIVRVTKAPSGVTTIDSRGYNTCSSTALRRFERGVTLTYNNF